MIEYVINIIIVVIEIIIITLILLFLLLLVAYRTCFLCRFLFVYFLISLFDNTNSKKFVTFAKSVCLALFFFNNLLIIINESRQLASNLHTFEIRCRHLTPSSHSHTHTQNIRFDCVIVYERTVCGGC